MLSLNNLFGPTQNPVDKIADGGLDKLVSGVGGAAGSLVGNLADGIYSGLDNTRIGSALFEYLSGRKDFLRTLYLQNKANNFTAQQNAIANAFTASQAEKAQNFSASEAQKLRDWQSVLANSAYQRSVADIKAAGLNPAIVLGGGAGGAVTPAGTSGTAYSGSGSAGSGSGATFHSSAADILGRVFTTSISSAFSLGSSIATLSARRKALAR